jgi:fibronectin-binding autotransporter adhesin
LRISDRELKMQRPANGRLSRNSTRRKLVLAAAASSLAAIPADIASAAVYTYTPASTTTDTWSAITDWSAIPASATTTTLTFVGTNTTVLANSLNNINTDNDTGLFSLNVLNLQGTGPASGAATITIAAASPGMGLDIDGSSDTVNLNALNGTAGLTYNVSAPITLDATTTFTGNGTANFNFSGVISGSGAGITKSGTSTLTLSNADTFSGTTTINSGILQYTGSGGNSGGGLIDINWPGVVAPTQLIISTSGEVDASELRFENHSTNDEQVNLTGGTLGIGATGITTPSGTSNGHPTFNFNGGTLKSLAAFPISSGVNVFINSATAVVDTSNGNITSSAAFLAGTGTGNLTVQGGSALILPAGNTYAGSTLITGSSTLQLNGTSTLSGAVTVNSGSTLDMDNASQSIAGLAGAGSVENSSALATVRNLTITGSGGNTFSGVISSAATNQANLAVNVNLTSGTQTFSGGNTYTGATTLTAGTLALGAGGSLANTAIAINSGATFAPTVGTSVGNTGTTGAGATVTLNSGGTLALVDATAGTYGTFTIKQNAGDTGNVLTLAGGALQFNIGTSTSATLSPSDMLAVIGGTGAVSVSGSTSITLNTAAATSLFAGATYDIMTATSGLASANLSLANPNVVVGGALYGLSLAGSSASTEVVTVSAGAIAPKTAYWIGDTGGGTAASSWATLDGTTFNGNFTFDAAGTANTYAVPVSGTNVTLTANTATNLATTLDQAFTINSLTFSGTGTSNTAGSSIAPGTGGTSSTLTINAAAVNGNTAGTGITVASGSGVNAISANVILGASQTWTNNSANALVVSGNVSDGSPTNGYALTKAGTGPLTLSGNNTYSGGTTLSAGTLNLNASGTASTNSAIGTGTLTIAGGTIDNTSGSAVTLATNNAVSLAGGANFAAFSAGETSTSNLNLGTGATNLNIPSSAGGNQTIITLNGTGTTLTLGAATGQNSNIAGELSVNGAGNTLVLGSLVTNAATSLAHNFTIGGNGNLTVNGAFSSGFSTGPILNMAGTGTVTLNGTSTCENINFNSTGTLTVGGTLTLNNGSATSLAAAANVTVNGAGSIVLSPGTTNNFGDIGASAGNTLTIATLLAGTNASTQGLEIYDATSAGTVVLTNSGNTFAGPVLIDGGILSVSQIGSSSGSTPATLGENADIDLNGNSTNSVLQYTGTGETTNRIINLLSTTGGGTLDDEGTGTLDFTANFATPGAGSKTLVLEGSTAGIGQIAGKIINNSGTNTTAVAKSGTGIWILSNSNSYSGGTTISSGTLLANNGSSTATTTTSATGTGAVTVNAGATLGGAGAVFGTVTLNVGTANGNGSGTAGNGATIAGGGSSSAPGILVTNAQTWNGASNLAAKIVSITGSGHTVPTAGTDYDQMQAGAITASTLANTASGKFDVEVQSGGSSAANFSTASNYTFHLATFSSFSGPSGFIEPTSGPIVLATTGSGTGAPAVDATDSQYFVLDTSSFTLANPGSSSGEFALELVGSGGTGTGLDLVYYASAPEPGTAMLVLAGAMPMLAGRRRRQRRKTEAN